MSPSPHGMRPADIALYLIGNRGAIERLAATRHAWAIGAILVLTAGIARNYDHLDLLYQAEWFIGPFVASLVSIGFIFLWILGPLKFHKLGEIWRQWGTFLVLAWMTAPCAWIYGIPVESMTDIMTATKWNIVFLAVVSIWRVAIMVRAVSVLAEVRWLRALPLVLAPAALEAFVGANIEALSLIGIMGGVRLPPHTQLLASAAGFTVMASFWIFIVSVIASFLVKGIAKRPLSRPASAGNKLLIPVTSLVLLAWVGVAIHSRPPIANRYRLESLIRQQDFDGAVAFASEKSREDFPQHHFVPPEPNQWFPDDLLQLLKLLPADAPVWLREEWTRNAVESLTTTLFYSDENWKTLENEHPAILNAVRKYADELRSRSELLNNDESRWLSRYETTTQPPAPPGP